MPVRKVDRNGESRLLIDIQYKTRDGKRARFRKDAEIQSMTAARAEEKRYLVNIAQYGSPHEPSETANNEDKAPEAAPTMTFAEVVDEFQKTFMVTDLKVTSRRGYNSVLRSTLVPRFGSLAIDKVDSKAAANLDLELTKRKLSQSTRNNTQIVLRSVMRFAKKREYIKDGPTNLPRLKPIGQQVLEIPSDEQVDHIIESAIESHRLTFALMSDAGLRPNEVRALRCKGVQLKWENSELIGGFITVREGRSYGEIHTPKTGQREIPISRDLARRLAAVVQNASREKHVACNDDGEPWGQHGIDQAFGRTAERAGVEGWSVYCLRHYAITSWLRAGIPVHVVQRMAGHKNLSTTQRYVHFLKGDLEEAARRLPTRLRGGDSNGNNGGNG